MLRRFVCVVLLVSIATSGSAQTAVTRKVCSGGGGMELSPRAYAGFAYWRTASGERGFDVIVARGNDGWVHQSDGRALVDPLPRQIADQLMGGSIDTLWLRIDPAQRVAWVHDKSVPLGSGNVLLVDRIDGVGGPLAILPSVRVDEPSGSVVPCDPTALGPALDSLRAILLGDPKVRAFVDRKARND